MKQYEQCKLCPRQCGANRLNGALGFCGASTTLFLARAALHTWEEPCLSGSNGSGTVFFSHCTLKCPFCQNYDVSRGHGYPITINRLVEIFLTLEAQGAHNINLVTPTQFVPHVIQAVQQAKASGLTLPIVYNCGGYESVETVALLEKIVDIWLPDFKFFSSKQAERFLKLPDYPQRAIEALDQMVQQCPQPVFDAQGILQSGVLIRHLLMPTLLVDSMQAISFLYDRYGDSVLYSLMSQYTPIPQCQGDAILGRRVNPAHYQALVTHVAQLDPAICYMQQESSADAAYIPTFLGQGL